MSNSVVTDDVQKFMELTSDMMVVIDDFMCASDVSTYVGFQKEMKDFENMFVELNNIIDHRKAVLQSC